MRDSPSCPDLHITVDTRTKQVLAMEVTERIGDSKEVMLKVFAYSLMLKVAKW
jgi:hypothetical protein